MATTKKSRTAEAFATHHILSALYFIAGATLLALMTQPKYIPAHLGLLGILNIIVSYSITKMKRWTLYVTASTSLLGLVFGGFSLAVTISFFSSDLVDMLVLSGIIAYMALSVATLVYLALKRNKFS